MCSTNSIQQPGSGRLSRARLHTPIVEEAAGLIKAGGLKAEALGGRAAGANGLS